MSAGTIALTNNSANVTGTGTAFTTDLKAGDFVVAIVGGVTYTLGVKAITSATALTLITAYGGPTASGNAWTAVPNATLVGITSQVAADVSKAIRGLNLDKANWQQVFSGTGTITVTLPDGSTYSGPAWSSITTSLNTKAGKGANTDITSLAGLTTALSIAQGGTGAITAAAALTALGAAATGANTFTGTQTLPAIELSGVTNPFIDFHYANDASDYTARIVMNDANALTVMGKPLDGANSFRCRRGIGGATLNTNPFNFYWNNTNLEAWIQTTQVGNVTLAAVSDKALKSDIAYMDENPDMSGVALSEVLQWRAATFKYKARGVLEESDTQLGFIANDLVLISPECVKGEGLKEGWDENNPEDAYYLDEIALIAKLTEALQTQQKQIEDLQRVVTALTQPQEQTS